jgi:ATP-dependent Clp protease adaptor protein ClpS
MTIFYASPHLIEPKNAVREDEDGGDVGLLEREPEKLKPPPRYAVLLLNDDYTPMEFVVAILRQVFNRSEDESVAIMLKVHTEGRGVCGVYTRDVAETRVGQVADLAKKFGHPLQCVAEPVDED